MTTRKIASAVLCLFFLWAALVTVDFFRLTNTDSYKAPLIPLGGIHYAYDYSAVNGPGYSIRYDYGGDETYDIKKITFRLLGKPVYEQEQ